FAPHSSLPSRKSDARTASTTSVGRASIIALVSPWLAAIARNDPPSVSRPGRPNDVFEAPQVVLTPSSSRNSLSVSTNSVTARGSAPTGIASGSMITSSGGMPWSPAALTIFFATSTRRSGSIGISSSFARPMTAAPCRATIGRIASSRSSSPVTELTSALPSYADRPASSASITDESMTSGRSVSDCTSGIACRISSISSASGSPTFTSSMSASGACCATSTSIRDRSPCCSSAWNFFRPVGLIRSPITQNGRPGPMTTSLDGDARTVSNRLPFVAGGDAEPFAQARDAGLLAKADQVQAVHSGQRTRGVGELARDLEALRLGVGSVLAARDELRRNGDAGDLLVDEAKRRGRAHEADRRQDRGALGQAHRHRVGHERAERLEVERDLQLQETRAGAHLLQRAVDDTPRLGLVARGDVVAGEAADVLDPVQRRPGDLRLQGEPVPVAADELHDRLHPQLLERDRDRERRRVRVRGGVVGRVHRVDPVLVRREVVLHGSEAAAVHGQQLRRDDEATRVQRVLKPRHASPSAQPCRAW